MKKAELNQIKRAAFDKWAEFPENIELLKFASCVTCWRVEEGTEVKLLQTTTDSQLNTNYLKKTGSARMRASASFLSLMQRLNA